MQRKDSMHLVIDVLSKLSTNSNFVFKGGVLLYSELRKNKINTIRYTEDLDMNSLIDDQDILLQELKYSGLDVAKVNHLPKYNSFSVELTNGVDLDIKITETVDVCNYTINGVSFKGMSPYNVMADKLSVVSGDMIFRRTKDLLDIYLWLKMFNFNGLKLSEVITDTGREIKTFSNLSIENHKLIHSYDKLKDVENKPTLSDVVRTVAEFISPLTIGGDFKDNHYWDKERLRWIKYLN